MEVLRILSSGDHWLTPRTELVRVGGRLYARKQYPRSSPLGRMLLNHEASVLRALEGVSGIPRIVEHLADRFFEIEYHEGIHVHECPPERLTREVFGRLVDLVDRMHARRVVHLDLRQRKNILIDPQGFPVIVDFQSSIYFPENGIFSPLFEICRWVDRSALIRWKHRYFPALMTDSDRLFQRFFMLLRPVWFVSPFTKRARDVV